MSRFRKGSVLVFALIATAIVTILVGSMGYYYVSSARLADRYMTGRSEPRALAQQVMEEVNQFIVNEVNGALQATKGDGSDPSITVSMSQDGVSLETVLDNLRKKIASDANINSKSADSKASGSKSADAKASDSFYVEVTTERIDDSSKYLLRVLSTVYSDASRREILSQIEEIIEFLSSASDALTTIPIFDYVYFANNSGRLTSPYIVANGEIGANGNFLINGATVNGYVDVTGEVSLEGDPKASPRKTYMAAISEEYETEFTPARPTNKLYDSAGNGQTWIGGYEPAKPTHSFTDPGPAPEEVADPGAEPEKPTIENPTYPEEPEYEEPEGKKYPTKPELKYPEAPKKETVTQPPSQSTITPKRVTETTTVTKWKYRNKEYDTEAAALAKQKQDGRSIEYVGGNKPYKYNNKNYKTKEDAEKQQKKDGRNITETTTTSTKTVTKYTYNGVNYDSYSNAFKAYEDAVDDYEERSKKAESDYQKALKNWEGEKATIKAKYDEDLAKWEKECSKIDGENEAAVAKAQEEFQKAHGVWESEYAAYVEGTNAYAIAWVAYDQSKAAYDVSNELYKTYAISNAVWESRVAQYASDTNNWNKSVNDGTFQETLNTKSVSETPLLLIRTPGADGVPNVDMPIDSNKTYVADYRDTVCKGGKGTLTCANRFRSGSGDKNISWSRTGQTFEEWQYAYKKAWIGGRTEYPQGHIFGTNYVEGSTIARTLAYVEVKDGYKEETYPFAARSNHSLKNTGNDPYYSDNDLKKAEKGSVILVGTANYPITIKGPVWFDGDVVIRGFVSGQGSIYAGRNIHIIGDLTYLNPPNWPNTKENVNSSTISNVKSKNANKDLLLLVARGNIIIGDYPSKEWQDDCREYLQIPQGYRSTDSSAYSTCHDGDIGYGSSFSCDYSAYEAAATGEGNDSNYKVSMESRLVSTKLYEDASVSERFNMWWTKLVVPYACNIRTYENTIHATKNKRRFYECKLGDEVIAGLMQSKSTDSNDESWKWSQWAIMRWLYRTFDVTQPHDNISSSDQDVSQASDAVAGDLDAGDITHIDAVLYANHGIFGRVGGTASHKFTLNGAMLCRDEGLLPSFAGRAVTESWTSPLPSAWLNWDMRIKSDSSEGLQGIGAKMDYRVVSGNVTNHVTSWRQLK